MRVQSLVRRVDLPFVRRFSQSVSKFPILDARAYEIDYSHNLGAVYMGSSLAGYSSAHDVFYAHKKASNSRVANYVMKFINKARVGEFAKECVYSTAEALEQAVLEVLAFNLGNAINPGQFAEANVVQDDKDKVWIVSKRVHPALSLKELIIKNDLDPEDPKQNVFYVEEIEQSQRSTRMPQEYISLPEEDKEEMSKNYEILDPVVIGRTPLKMALYILGDVDPRMNKHNNVLVKWGKKRYIDEEKKTMTPTVELVLVDAGLCFDPKVMTDEMIIKAAKKLASRESDSHKMFDLNGHPPVNLKYSKDQFLLNFIKTYESGILEDHLEAASEHLSLEKQERFAGFRSRAKVCYLAGLLVKEGLGAADKQEEALHYLKEQMDILGDKMRISGDVSQNCVSAGISC